MSHTSDIEAMLFSPEYWDGPIHDPISLISDDQVIDNAQAAKETLGDKELAQEIGNVVLSFKGGGQYHVVPECKQVPLPDKNTRQVVKLVIDSKQTIPRLPLPFDYGLSRTCRRLEDMHKQKGLKDLYDEFSEIMLNPNTIYNNCGISIIGMGRSVKNIVLVQRCVQYMRGVNEELGAMLDSVFIDIENDNIDEKASCSVIPALDVGQIYGSERDMNKIHSATLLEATGLRWRHHGPKGPKRDNRKRQGLWLPGLQLNQ